MSFWIITWIRKFSWWKLVSHIIFFAWHCWYITRAHLLHYCMQFHVAYSPLPVFGSFWRRSMCTSSQRWDDKDTTASLAVYGYLKIRWRNCWRCRNCFDQMIWCHDVDYSSVLGSSITSATFSQDASTGSMIGHVIWTLTNQFAMWFHFIIQYYACELHSFSSSCILWQWPK